MNKRLLTLCAVFVTLFIVKQRADAQAVVDARLKSHLEAVYMQWRKAMIKKNYNLWAQFTATHRQVHIKNRIVSERKPYPAMVFNVPASPPSLAGLKALNVRAKGATAIGVYFGKVDFGVGGKPTENLLVLHYVNERGRWKYDMADYIRLNDLKDVRKKLKAGDLSYVNQKDFQPSGVVPRMPIEVGRAKYIAKIHVVAPGREVKMRVNKVSDHRVQNDIVSEVVLGGGVDGLNEVQFATKSLEGSTGKEVLRIRVFLMSVVKGVQPVKVFDYWVKENGAVKKFGSANFVIDRAMVNKLNGK